MTAQDVRECLAVHWPDEQYLNIEEAPEDSSRQGRRLDLLVVALWRSRGLELDGVEIKVSLSDWRRELKEAAKADFWWRHTNRFWVAVPASIAIAVREDLPPTWGLLACDVGKPTKVVKKPPRKEAEPLPWSTTVGLLRTAADSGFAALPECGGAGRLDRGAGRATGEEC